MDILCFFANAVFIGDEITYFDDGGWSKNKITFHAFGYDVEWTQRNGFNKSFINDRRYEFIETSSALVKGVEDIAHFEASMVKLSYILSFALNSQVVFYSYIENTNNQPSYGKQRSVMGVYSGASPLLSATNGLLIKRFIESCWVRFDELYHTRRLNVVIDYFTTADAKQLQVEIKLSLFYTLLECLKSTYAKANGYPFKDGWFYYRDSDCKIKDSSLLIKRMLSDTGMELPCGILSERNSLIHEGISLANGESVFTLYSQGRDLIGEYILRILGFSGEYCLHNGRGMETKEI